METGNKTTRKALITLLNRHLTTILKDHNVLQANQFAGLPKQSTFEPIRIVNELLQDAIDNNNELWILFQDMDKAYDRVNTFQLKKAMERIRIPTAYTTQEEPTEIFQQNIPVMAYMDDTQWITDEKHKLEKMLYIADSFYRLNDIQINKDKSELMMRAKKRRHRYSHNYNDKILIQFGRDHINIKAKHPCEPTRILGVHFNIENDNRYLISKIKTEVDHLTNLMYKKKITDKHILYIFNRIIIPRIEYWSQVTVLSKKDTENLIIPFRRMFKNKLKFARTAPNAILDNPYIYGYRNLYENQLQVKITEFCIQLNDTGVLGKVTQIRLKSLQIQLWSSTNLVQKIPFNKISRSMMNNYLLNMSLLCKENNISFNIINRNEFSNIGEGKVPLTDVVSNKFYSEFRPTLRRNLILFLDQVISGDKSRLLLWADIVNKYYYPQDTNNKDSHPYDIEQRDRSLVATYNPHHNSFLLGKVHKFNNDDSVVLKHFISDFSLSTIDRTYVSQCDIPHCNVNTSTKGSICTFTAQHQHLVPLLTARKFTKEKIKESHYINYNAFNLFDIAKKKFELSQSPLSNSHVTTMHQQENIILNILEPSPSRNKLLIIQRTLAVCNNPNRHIFEFYTDGSLINPGSKQCSISCSFALLQNTFNIPEVEFSCTVEKWPSAYRGELLAVTLALIVIPPNSKVMIKTDSLNVISQFEQLKKSRFSQSAREYFKTNNNFLWNVLIRIITKLNLLVELFKVPAHADCDGNNYADKLTKDAHFDQDNHILFKSDATTMKLLPQWNRITIENKLRRFIRTTTTYKGLEKFINLRRNMKYRKLEVDWTSTFQCLNCDIQNNETSMSSSKIKAQKVHLLIEEIPTIKQMEKSFLEIYDDWKCPSCGLEDEIFNHVWSCDEHKNTLLRIRNRTIDLLVYWILECDSHLQNVPVASSLHSLHIWDIGYNINEFTFIDLIKGIIPSMLYHTINSWITKDNSIKILIQMRQYIFEQTFTEV
ncbi:ribonuclease H-like domain-containing protein [Rhizophagus clarus]|uniref:Ribonuclease H-like domain-containing protein n=1 Tax=Rhizophagus clarus TaxID=94130 RepID=A0A8H3LDK7_9GLOM|nr:ribonuclease H-like domain-containing protein [Rhizophagus clarus]